MKSKSFSYFNLNKTPGLCEATSIMTCCPSIMPYLEMKCVIELYARSGLLLSLLRWERIICLVPPMTSLTIKSAASSFDNP